MPSRKPYSTIKTAGLIAFFLILTKFLGVLRNSLLAAYFGGASTQLDIYFASFKIPDFIFNLLILGTLSAAFIPVYTQQLEIGKEQAHRLARSVLYGVVFLILCTALLAAVFAHPLAWFLAPGFDFAAHDNLVSLLRVMLVSPVLLAISSVWSGMLQSERRFLGTSVAPLLYNAGIILGIVVFYPQFGLIGLSYGVVVGAFLHSLVQYIELAVRGFHVLGPVSFRSSEFKKVLGLFLPRIIGMDISQVALLFSSYFGSLLAAGSIAAYSFSYDIAAVPLSLGGVALAIATFPVLSALFAQQRHLDFLHTVQKTISQIVWLLVPVSLSLFVFRDVVIHLLLVWGNFSTVHAETVAELLAVLSISLVAQSLAPILSRAFYARHTTVIPVLINIFSIALMTAASFWLAPSYGIRGIALSFSVVSIINALVLLLVLVFHMRRDVAFVELRQAISSLLHQFVIVLVSGVAAAALGLWFLGITLPDIVTASFYEVVTGASISGGVTIIMFLVVSYILGAAETNALMRRLGRKS